MCRSLALSFLALSGQLSEGPVENQQRTPMRRHEASPASITLQLVRGCSLHVNNDTTYYWTSSSTSSSCNNARCMEGRRAKERQRAVGKACLSARQPVLHLAISDKFSFGSQLCFQLLPVHGLAASLPPVVCYRSARVATRSYLDLTRCGGIVRFDSLLRIRWTTYIPSSSPPANAKDATVDWCQVSFHHLIWCRVDCTGCNCFLFRVVCLDFWRVLFRFQGKEPRQPLAIDPCFLHTSPNPFFVPSVLAPDRPSSPA